MHSQEITHFNSKFSFTFGYNLLVFLTRCCFAQFEYLESKISTTHFFFFNSKPPNPEITPNTWSPPTTETVFVQLDVWPSRGRMIYVQRLTLEGCFLIHLLEGEQFAALKYEFNTWKRISWHCTSVWNLNLFTQAGWRTFQCVRVCIWTFKLKGFKTTFQFSTNSILHKYLQYLLMLGQNVYTFITLKNIWFH